MGVFHWAGVDGQLGLRPLLTLRGTSRLSQNHEHGITVRCEANTGGSAAGGVNEPAPVLASPA
ncbi:hypothetical protein ACE1SV_74610 [Streptomyces sennicomposti]